VKGDKKMEWMYRVLLLALVVGVCAGAESWIICRVYKLGRADGWAAARSLYRDWRRGNGKSVLTTEADAA